MKTPRKAWLVAALLAILPGFSAPETDSADTAAKSVCGAPRDLRSDTLPLPLRLDRNAVRNSAGLSAFVKKLKELEKGTRREVSVVHIGDSHIQAGFFTAPVREWFHTRYGNAGRGLVFPYRQIKTNGPLDYGFQRGFAWKGCGITNTVPPCAGPLTPGISGYAAEAIQSGGRLALTMGDTGDAFSTLEIFSSVSPGAAFCLGVPPDTGRLLAEQAHPAPWLHVFTFDSAVVHARISCCRPLGSDAPVSMQGIVLKNGRPGVVYHTIGVNGAKVSDYLAAPLFWEQLPSLRPDLIIVSLGVNEAFETNFSAGTFIMTVDSLRARAAAAAPGAALLITTPNDHDSREKAAILRTVTAKSGRKIRRNISETVYFHNDRIVTCHKALVDYCDEAGLPCWDFFDIMGGSGSIEAWVKGNYAAHDHLHFTPAGYGIISGLFIQALEKSIDSGGRGQ